MNRCFWKDCSGEVVGALAHTYAPSSWVWYCADHSPSSDHWHNQTLLRITDLLERIAIAVEVHTQATTGYPPLRRVTREEWEKLTPLARQGAYTE